jgi:DNA processing protein
MDARLLRYWIGFNRAKGIGPIRQRMLTEHFGSIELAWNASPQKLQQAGLDQRSLQSLLSTRTTFDFDAEMRAIERAGAWVLTLEDAQYPPLLRQIPDPPPLLYVKGTLSESDWNAMAVVGTRRATTYGKTMTHDLVEPMARLGITIVSGLARGIDATAHETALEAGGRTIAVMANGIDRVYPPEHRQLAESITANGALISELPIGEPAESSHFAPRNRIVSGMSHGTLVVEAAEHSGALMTANLAVDQGREVFAVPGNALSSASKGTNTLIQNGAKMVLEVKDILNELKLDVSVPETRIQPSAPDVPKVEGETEIILLRNLSGEPQHIDNLLHETGLPISTVVGNLTLLELKGLVRQEGVLLYALTNLGLAYIQKY